MKKLQGLTDTPNNHSVATILAIAFCLAQLSGCGVVSNSGGKNFASSYDGPPAVDVDVSKIHDAVPKAEPFHPYGTKDYVLGGRRYHVLKNSKGYNRTGYASWYGSKFHGGETSTQEKFNLYAMTAASPHLPIPSYVQVTNMNNGKKVIVRVNDRGPFHPNRILDLSYAAAKKLGFADRGVAPVKIVAIDPETWGKDQGSAPSKKVVIARSESPMGNSPVFLQVGAFAELDNAKHLSNKINQLIDKHPVHIEHKSDLYRVQIGPIASSSQSNKIKVFLEDNGFDHVTVVGG